MTKNPCVNCQNLLDGSTSRRHPELQRSGLSKSVGYHGNRDDEYFYTCKECGFTFIGDSMGTWPATNN